MRTCKTLDTPVVPDAEVVDGDARGASPTRGLRLAGNTPARVCRSQDGNEVLQLQKTKQKSNNSSPFARKKGFTFGLPKSGSRFVGLKFVVFLGC